MTAKGHLNSRCVTDSSTLHLAHKVETGMFLIANCSPTGSAPCRDFHIKTLILLAVLMFQMLESQSGVSVCSGGSAKAFSSIIVR